MVRLVSSLVVVAVLAIFNYFTKNSSQNDKPQNQDVSYYLENKKDSYYIEITQAKVVKVLEDDQEDIKHQKWLVRLPSNHTLLAIYNIDYYERVPIQEGDEISLAGELGHNDQTGKPFIHWLHLDDTGKRPYGYVKLKGKYYGLEKI